MLTKEERVQKALGTLPRYIVRCDVTFEMTLSSSKIVDALSWEEAEKKPFTKVEALRNLKTYVENEDPKWLGETMEAVVDDLRVKDIRQSKPKTEDEIESNDEY